MKLFKFTTKGLSTLFSMQVDKQSLWPVVLHFEQLRCGGGAGLYPRFFHPSRNPSILVNIFISYIKIKRHIHPVAPLFIASISVLSFRAKFDAGRSCGCRENGLLFTFKQPSYRAFIAVGIVELETHYIAISLLNNGSSSEKV